MGKEGKRELLLPRASQLTRPLPLKHLPLKWLDPQGNSQRIDWEKILSATESCYFGEELYHGNKPYNWPDSDCRQFYLLCAILS